MIIVIDWNKYPKLAPIFAHRPAENAYTIELLALINEQIELVINRDGEPTRETKIERVCRCTDPDFKTCPIHGHRARQHQ